MRFDKAEALLQHDFLLEIMLKKPEWMLGTTDESMIYGIVRVLKTYGVILNNHKIYNDEIKNKMKQHVMSLPQVPIFAQQEAHIWSSLNETERQNIQKLCSS